MSQRTCGCNHWISNHGWWDEHPCLIPDCPCIRYGNRSDARECRHPVQPLIEDTHGVLRFKENKIVAWLARERLNEIARIETFTNEDRCQLMQLIGFSLSGYGDLTFVNDEEYARADQQRPEAKA